MIRPSRSRSCRPSRLPTCGSTRMCATYWDDLVLSSSITFSGARIPYQEVKCAQLLNYAQSFRRQRGAEKRGRPHTPLILPHTGRRRRSVTGEDGRDP